MKIELIGFTSSGKSTLLGKLIDKDETFANNISYNKFLPGKINKRVKELLIDFTYILVYGFFTIFYLSYLAPVILFILRRNDTFYMKLNLTRNLVRKLSLFKIAKTFSLNLLFDEGFIQTLHNSFVSFDKKLSKVHIKQVLKLVKKVGAPDHLIILKTSEDIFFDRLKKRKDAPWENKSKTEWLFMYSQSRYFLEEVITYLTSELSSSILVINNDGDSEEALEKLKGMVWFE